MAVELRIDENDVTAADCDDVTKDAATSSSDSDSESSEDSDSDSDTSSEEEEEVIMLEMSSMDFSCFLNFLAGVVCNENFLLFLLVPVILGCGE